MRVEREEEIDRRAKALALEIHGLDWRLPALEALIRDAMGRMFDELQRPSTPLPERNEIILDRWMRFETAESIGLDYGLSAQRTQQIVRQVLFQRAKAIPGSTLASRRAFVRERCAERENARAERRMLQGRK